MKATRSTLVLALGLGLLLLVPGEAMAAKKSPTDVLFGAISESSMELLMESKGSVPGKVKRKCQKDRQALVTDNGALAFSGPITGPSYLVGYGFEPGPHDLVFTVDPKRVRYQGTKYGCKTASVSEFIVFG